MVTMVYNTPGTNYTMVEYTLYVVYYTTVKYTWVYYTTRKGYTALPVVYITPHVV